MKRFLFIAVCCFGIESCTMIVPTQPEVKIDVDRFSPFTNNLSESQTEDANSNVSPTGSGRALMKSMKRPHKKGTNPFPAITSSPHKYDKLSKLIKTPHLLQPRNVTPRQNHQESLFQKTLPLAKKDYELYREEFGEEHPNTLSKLNNLAVTYQKLGRYTEALPLNEKTYYLRKKILGENNPTTLESLNNLAVNYSDLGRFTESLKLHEKTYTLFKKTLSENHPSTLSSLANIAVAYDGLERHTEALQYDEKVYTLRKKTLTEKHPDTLQSIANLAVSYSKLKRYTEALPLNEKAYNLRKEILGERYIDTLSSLNNLAWNYIELARYTEALPLNEKAYALRKETLGKKHIDTLSSLSNLAYNYAVIKEYEKAINYFEQALTNFETLLSNPQSNTDIRLTMLKDWRSAYFKLIELYQIQQQDKNAFLTLEKTKSRGLLEEMARKFAIHHAQLGAEDIEAWETLNNTIGKLEEMIAKTSELDERQKLRAEHTDLTQQRAKLHNYLNKQYPKYHHLSSIQIIDVENGKTLLPNDSLFVSYLVEKEPIKKIERVLVFILDNEGKIKSYNLGEIPNIEQTIKTYCQILAANGILKLRKEGLYVFELEDGSFTIANEAPENSRKLGEEDEGLIGAYLSNKLLVPLKDSLSEKERWVISPDGALALLPFETLPFNQKMVIEQHSVNYVQSLSVLNLLKQRQTAYQSQTDRKSLLAMGAARYEKPEQISTKTNINPFEINARLKRGASDQQSLNQLVAMQQKEWKNLPASERELQSLETLFEKEQPLILRKEKASEAHLLELNKQQALTHYRYLLFSTHGYFSPIHPALSGIVLDQLHTPAPTDGYINAAEWVGYDLRSDLMVLSACETGVGQTSGDGVLGLPYALYVAGNTNTLLTLWTILDDSTAEFMRRFFSRLQQGENHVDALTSVKREFLKEDKYRNPLHWAAFILYGI